MYVLVVWQAEAWVRASVNWRRWCTSECWEPLWWSGSHGCWRR